MVEYKRYRELYNTNTTAIFMLLKSEEDISDNLYLLKRELLKDDFTMSNYVIDELLQACRYIAENIYDLQESDKKSYILIEETVEVMMEHVFGEESSYQIEQQLREIFYGK